MESVNIRHDFSPGDVGRLVELHGTFYHQEYGFDTTFEAYVAEPLARFALARTERERIWLVDLNDSLCGSLAIVMHTEKEAQLRWYLLHPLLRGRGLGTTMVHEAVEFCRKKGYERIFLWTVSELAAAARVYQKVGFRLSEEMTHTIWGRPLTEQRYDLVL